MKPVTSGDHEWLRVVLAIAGGFAFGLLVFSFVSVAWLVRSRGEDYVQFVDALGSFIGGTLQALALMAVGWGLLLQSRQLGEERRLAADDRRWEYFNRLLGLHREAGEKLAVFVPADEGDAAEAARESRTALGVSAVEQALTGFARGLGNNVGLDWGALAAYVQSSDRLSDEAGKIEDQNRRALAASLAESGRCGKVIREAVEWRNGKLALIQQAGQSSGLTPDERKSLSRLCEISSCIELAPYATATSVRVLPADGSAWTAVTAADVRSALQAAIKQLLPDFQARLGG
jgi:hypothetical protein